MKVLHIVPDSIYDPRHFYLGSTKDIRGRTEYFKERKIACDEITVEKRKDKNLLKKLRKLDLKKYKVVLCEFLLYPMSLKFLKKNYPHITIIVRSHNAEFLHRLHYIKASILHRQWKSFILNTLLFFKIPFTDFLCARQADFVMSISSWEKENYWRYLVDRRKVENLPYFIPAPYRRSVHNSLKKTQQCVSLMSTDVNSFVLDAAKNYIKLVRDLKDNCKDWEFFITGNLSNCKIKLPARITPTGFLDSPNKILAESMALALISDYGFGLKTKLLDAIYYKCYLIVTRSLYRRLPLEIRNYCAVVDLYSKDSFKNVLEKCLEPYPEGNPNNIFRQQAFAALDKLV